MSEKMKLEFFVSGGEEAAALLRAELEDALTQHDIEADIVLVDVLTSPEKALASEVFATPTILRTFPEPVLKIIANAAAISNAVVLIKEAKS